MIILDENILSGQRVLLEARRIAVRQIGADIGRKGLSDEQIIVLLRRGRNLTFFTRDAGFYLPGQRHRSYCVAVMNVGQNEVAAFVCRFLRQPGFDTQADGRSGSSSQTGLTVWSQQSHREFMTVGTGFDNA